MCHPTPMALQASGSPSGSPLCRGSPTLKTSRGLTPSFSASTGPSGLRQKNPPVRRKPGPPKDRKLGIDPATKVGGLRPRTKAYLSIHWSASTFRPGKRTSNYSVSFRQVVRVSLGLPSLAGSYQGTRAGHRPRDIVRWTPFTDSASYLSIRRSSFISQPGRRDPGPPEDHGRGIDPAT